jgi:hypothetical protein
MSWHEVDTMSPRREFVVLAGQGKYPESLSAVRNQSQDRVETDREVSGGGSRGASGPFAPTETEDHRAQFPIRCAPIRPFAHPPR